MSAGQRGRSASAPHSRPLTSASSSASRLRTGEDVPHIAGSAECLCSACHLKTYFFPRRQDGRIVLPPPNPTRQVEEPPHVVGSSVSSHGAREAREASMPRQDRGEGTSAGSGQLSGPGVPAGVPEDWTHLPPLLRDFELPYLMGRGTPRMPPAEIHPSRSSKYQSRIFIPGPNGVYCPPFPDRSKPSRKKPYDAKTQPWPRISSSGVDQSQPLSRSASHPGLDFPNPYTEITSQPTNIPSSSGRLSWPDPYESIVEEPFPQLFRTPLGLGQRDFRVPDSYSKTHPSGDRDINLSSSSTQSQTMSSSHDSEHHPPRNPYLRGYTAPSRGDFHPLRNEHATMQPPSQGAFSAQDPPREVNSSNIEDHPHVIRFNSRHNPQPDAWVSPINVEGIAEDDRSESQEGSSQQTHTGMLRFQNPLVPESHVPVPTSSRELSIVHVKWDSERKRRQGYFAQEEGAEKSPFRHYNKTGCDFNG